MLSEKRKTFNCIQSIWSPVSTYFLAESSEGLECKLFGLYN